MTDKYRNRCIDEYYSIVSANPKIDAGHSVNHVIKVESWTSRALQEFLQMYKKDHPTLQKWYHNSIEFPGDVALRVEAASLLHEVGDSKFKDGAVQKTKVELLTEVLDRVFRDYPEYSSEMRTDIINMVDYCGASTWGDRIPPGSRLYQLIPRWADRLEATGIIGIVRTMTYAYVKRASYPLCRDEDEFPTTLEELEKFAPPSRWEKYSSGKRPSESGFSHYLDKIVHISGKDIPIPCLRDALNEGQTIVKQFVIDFTVVHGKRFDIDWILSKIDNDIYNVEVDQLKEMQQVFRDEGSKWIK